jgi:hypothetical protein
LTRARATGAGDDIVEQVWRWLRRLALPLALVVLAAAGASVLLPLASVGHYFERSWNEGWNAYQQARAAAGGQLYGADPWRPVNYPFLSFYLAGWLAPLFGNVLFAGRALNLAGLAAVLLCSALFVRRCGGGTAEMLFAAGCVLGFQQIQAADWLAVDEPQVLAEAFMLGGLLLYVSGPPSWPRLFICALLFAAGGFVKQIVVVFPAAVTVDLWWRYRNRFFSWLVCLTLAAALFVTASTVVAGGDFLTRVLEPRVWLWPRVLYHAKKLLFFLKGPVLASIVVLCRRLPPQQDVLLRAAGVAALAAGIAFAGGDGVSVNVFLELAVVMGLLAGVALAGWCGGAPLGRGAAVIGMLLPLLFASPILARLERTLPPLIHLAASRQAIEARQERFLSAAAWLREQPGAALCESLLLCFAAGKPLVIDPYGAREKILTGRADEDTLIHLLAEHRFAVIALRVELREAPGAHGRIVADVLTKLRFTPATLAAIVREYAPTMRLPAAVFYTPRQQRQPHASTRF